MQNERDLDRYAKVFDDKEFWKQVGDEHDQALIVTGSVVFVPQAREGFVQREQETYDSFGRRVVEPIRTYQQRKGYILRPTFVFIDGRTGEQLYSESFREEVLYNSNQQTPALSSYFELMDRLLPTFLNTLSAQKIKREQGAAQVGTWPGGHAARSREGRPCSRSAPASCRAGLTTGTPDESFRSEPPARRPPEGPPDASRAGRLRSVLHFGVPAPCRGSARARQIKRRRTVFAIIKASGRQFRVEPGAIIAVDGHTGEAGAPVAFDQVLLVGKDAGEVLTGAPFVDRRRGRRRDRPHRQGQEGPRVQEEAPQAVSPDRRATAAC